MLKVFILSSILFLHFFSNEQSDFLIYYSSIDSAKTSLKKKLYSDALKHYRVAYNEFGFLHDSFFKEAIRAAKKTNNDSLKSEYILLKKEQLKRIDHNYKEFVDSLYYWDQKVRNSKSIKAVRYINLCKTLPSSEIDRNRLTKDIVILKNWRKIDSLNTTALIKAIYTNGFPNESVVGIKSFDHTFDILIHFGLYSMSHDFQSILNSALRNGDLKPSYYARIIDCQRVRCQKKQLYCQFLPYAFERLTELEKKEVIKNRNQIGLYSLDYKYGGIFGKWSTIR